MIDKKELTDKIIKLALEEDRANQDITTNALIDFDKQVEAEVIAQEAGVMSGTKVFKKTFQMIDLSIIVNILIKDGEPVYKGDRVILIRGRESSILKAERAALNFLQRLSGVATITARFVKEIEGFPIKLLDTRKTTPGMRYLQKQAVKDGGGSNHRFNLEDMALIKDNHIRMAGSITDAVEKVKEKNPKKKIEVEVKDLIELNEALNCKVDIIMLDNFKDSDIEEAIIQRRGNIRYEISGNVTLENIKKKIKNGIDYISIGALTHSFKSLDLSLNIIET